MRTKLNSTGTVRIIAREKHPAWESFQAFLKRLPQAVTAQLSDQGNLFSALWLGYKEGWEDAIQQASDKVIRWTEDE